MRSSSGRRRPTPPTSTISSGSTCRQRSIAAEQEALLDLYRSTRKGCLERWWYRMRVAEAAAAYKEASKEGDEAGESLFRETEDEAEDNVGSDKSPLCWRRRRPAPPRPRGANNEAEDTAGSAEAPPRQQRGRGHHRLSRGPTVLKLCRI